MKKELTKQDILDMIAKSRQESAKSRKESDERSRKFNEDLAKSRKEWEGRSKKSDEELTKNRKEWENEGLRFKKIKKAIKQASAEIK